MNSEYVECIRTHIPHMRCLKIVTYATTRLMPIDVDALAQLSGTVRKLTIYLHSDMTSRYYPVHIVDPAVWARLDRILSNSLPHIHLVIDYCELRCDPTFPPRPDGGHSEAAAYGSEIQEAIRRSMSATAARRMLTFISPPE